jgi:hypothetical protein
MARLSDAFLMMATGRSATSQNLLQGTTDNSFKMEKRTTLGNIRSLEDLDTRLQSLSSNKDTVLEHVEGNLKIVLMGAGYTAPDAAMLVPDSPFLRISGDCQSAYISLHMHLLATALRQGWDHVRSELHYYVSKLKEIRELYQTRLQVVAHDYCYLRDLQKTGWQTFDIQDIRIRELQASLGSSPPLLPGASSRGLAVPPTTGRAHFCNHCKTNLHLGNTTRCFWKASSAADARKAGANTVRNLATFDPKATDDDSD